MKRLTTTAALIALTAGTAAYADNHNAEKAMENAEQAAQNTGQAIETETKETVAQGEQAMEKAADDLFGNENDGLIRTRDITGGAVYAMDTEGEGSDWNPDMSYDSVEDGWEQVGEIEDIVLNADGSFKGIVAEVGGFLDMSDKHVMLEISDAKFVPIDDGSYSVVTNMTPDELDSLEDVDESPMN
ncbi:hypothetical protein AYJ57_21250 (plasmid) [Salipiger sp. CCB-MM3]|uniref:PRC-barrel domain-containing protein n=1 Tax=Salipiger sp. CCB-MM3 TaxID=1792508 RepID=UPI00080A990C|nr:PRC-barrel domain-containing protein [Salipiger sp. CCB-MM3]ANT63004.1 hypothetical protein AYJ57_21250 [Salipiger sp. CCB-MM3]